MGNTQTNNTEFNYNMDEIANPSVQLQIYLYRRLTDLNFEWNDYLETLQMLIDNGADVNQSPDEARDYVRRNFSGWQARIIGQPVDYAANMAAKFTNLEPLKLLIQNGVDFNIPNTLASIINHGEDDENYNETVLDAARLIIENGADVNRDDPDGVSPIIHAIENENVNMVQLLVDNGADVNKKSVNGPISLIVALFNTNHEIVKILIEAGADVNFVIRDTVYDNTYSGFTALHAAIIEGDTEMDSVLKNIQMLIDAGADVNKGNDDGETPLHTAVLAFRFNIHLNNNSNLDRVIKLLIENGADVNKKDNDGMTPFYHLITKYHNKRLETVKLFMENGADINAADKDGLTPFHAILSTSLNGQDRDAIDGWYGRKDSRDIVEGIGITVEDSLDITSIILNHPGVVVDNFDAIDYNWESICRVWPKELVMSLQDVVGEKPPQKYESCRENFPEQLVKAIMPNVGGGGGGGGGGGKDVEDVEDVEDGDEEDIPDYSLMNDSPIREDIEIAFRTKLVDNKIYSEIGIPKRQAHLFPEFAKILEDGEKSESKLYITEILDQAQYWRICYLAGDIGSLRMDSFDEYDGIEKLKPYETINKWIHLSLFYCQHTLDKDRIPDRERSLFQGSGRMMFEKTMADIDPEIPIWLEAESMFHTLKDKHPLFNLYKSMGFEMIGSFSDAYAEKQWNEREEDGEDNSILGETKQEQIANFKWSTALMINLREAPSGPCDGVKMSECEQTSGCHWEQGTRANRGRCVEDEPEDVVTRMFKESAIDERDFLKDSVLKRAPMVKKQKGKCDDKLKRNCHKKDGCEWTPGTTRNGKRVKGRCNEMETQPEVDDILQSIQDETQELEKEFETIDRSSAEGFGEGSGKDYDVVCEGDKCRRVKKLPEKQVITSTDSVSERLSSIATRKQGCSKFSKAKCEDESRPHCKWIKGKGCRDGSEISVKSSSSSSRSSRSKSSCNGKLMRNCHSKDGCKWIPGTTRNGKRVKGKCVEDKTLRYNMETNQELQDRLFNAARSYDLEEGVIEDLMNEGANINLRSPMSGLTPLSMALVGGHPRNRLFRVEELLKNGANPNLVGLTEGGVQGHTPLFIAVVNDYVDEAALLLEYGADPYFQHENEDGATPLSISQEKQNPRLVNMFNQVLQNPGTGAGFAYNMDEDTPTWGEIADLLDDDLPISSAPLPRSISPKYRMEMEDDDFDEVLEDAEQFVENKSELQTLNQMLIEILQQLRQAKIDKDQDNMEKLRKLYLEKLEERNKLIPEEDKSCEGKELEACSNNKNCRYVVAKNNEYCRTKVNRKKVRASKKKCSRGKKLSHPRKGKCKRKPGPKKNRGRKTNKRR